MSYYHQKAPFVVPTDDGKLIEEHFGLASTGEGQASLAHMVAPPHWSEPFQRPEFDEYTFLYRGRKKIEADGIEIILNPGESLLIKAETRVRYSNPFEEEAEYVSFCLPAFSPDGVHREE